jgi:hypothetical protein
LPIPDAEPGLVIRYDYLWSRQNDAGLGQGKDRPACLVAASDRSVTPRYVVILPITHTAPDADTVGIEIPEAVRRALGLDDAPSWVVLSEHNVDEWPNGGLSPVPGDAPRFAYGFVPPRLFAQIKAKFIELVRSRQSSRVLR